MKMIMIPWNGSNRNRAMVFATAAAMSTWMSPTVAFTTCGGGARASFVATRATRRAFSHLGRSRLVLPWRGAATAQGNYQPTMLFGNLFSGMGMGTGMGFVEAVIDYEALNHPGPELARFAEDGQVVVNSSNKPKSESESDPTTFKAATFSGGCFWGMELAYQRVPGVAYTAVGYTQGREEFPTYGKVSAEATGHTEAVCVYYNPDECTYNDLLDTFFARVNPLTANGQGKDFGKQYRTGVYYHTPEQEESARARFAQEQSKHSRPIATELRKAVGFWPAEKYHQQYLSRGGPRRISQNSDKGCTDTIRCYG